MAKLFEHLLEQAAPAVPVTLVQADVLPPGYHGWTKTRLDPEGQVVEVLVVVLAYDDLQSTIRTVVHEIAHVRLILERPDHAETCGQGHHCAHWGIMLAWAYRLTYEPPPPPPLQGEPEDQEETKEPRDQER